MNAKKVLFYLLAALLGGCLPVMSLQPFYTDSDIVFEEKLLGTWTDDSNDPETTWEFTRADEPNNAYRFIFTEGEEKGSFIARLIRLKDSLFLDVYPTETSWDIDDPNKVKWIYNNLFLIPAHTLLKVDSIEPQLKMRMTLDTKMEELLKENPNAVKYISVEDRPVLTASIKELQEFVLKYADDERLFADAFTLVRKPVQAQKSLSSPPR
jgi:hypothetical protein